MSRIREYLEEAILRWEREKKIAKTKNAEQIAAYYLEAFKEEKELFLRALPN